MNYGVGGRGRLLGNITIGKKLYGLAATLLAFVLVIGIVSISGLGSANSAGQSMYRGSALPGLELGKISTATVDAHRSLLRTLLYPTDKTIYTQEVASRAKDNATVSTSSSRTLTIVLLLIAVGLGAGIAYLIARSITGPARQMLDAAKGIAEGDVDQEIDVRSTDEIGQTARAFQDMIAYLKGLAGVSQRMADELNRLVEQFRVAV